MKSPEDDGAGDLHLPLLFGLLFILGAVGGENAMWRIWLLAGYSAGFTTALFVAWMLAGEDVPLQPQGVALVLFLGLLLHLPALAELRPRRLDYEAVVDRWVFGVGVSRVLLGAAAFGVAGVTVAAATYEFLDGDSGFRWAGLLAPPVALALANSWVLFSARRTADVI